MDRRKIIVALDLPWCLKKATCKLLVYEGGIRITKKGKVSGCLRQCNPFFSPAITPETKSVPDLFEKSSFLQTAANEFMTTWKCFRECAKSLCEIGVLCLRDDLGKYTKIESVHLLDVADKRFIWMERSHSLVLAWPEYTPVLMKAPAQEKPVIKLQRTGKRLIFELRFGKDQDASADDAHVDLKARGRFEKKLTSLGFLKNRRNAFAFPTDQSELELINALIETGAEVYYTDDQRITRASSVSSKFSYGLDWFHVNFEVETESGKKDVSELVLQHSSGDYVRLGTQIVRIPPALKEKRWSLDSSGRPGTIKIHKSSLLYAEELAAETQNTLSVNSCMVPYETLSCELPAPLSNLLKPYQREGIKWLKCLYANRLGGILADDMGLGKTVQAISLMTESSVASVELPVLVITTRSLVTNWVREIEKFAPHLSPVLAECAEPVWSARPSHLACSIVVATYAQIRLRADWFISHNFKLVVYDEIQSAKSSESQTYHALRRIHSPFSIGLSGTPLENNLSELWSVFSLVNPSLLGGKSTFLRKYSQSLSLLKERIAPFMLRRTKAEVLSELPPYSEEVVYCDMLPSQSRLYNALLEEFRKDLRRKLRRNEIYDSSRWLRYLLYLRMTCSHPAQLPIRYNPKQVRESCKFDYVISKVMELSACSRKCVVFGQFIHHMHLLRRALEDAGITTYYVDGGTQARQDIVDAFNATGSAVLIASLKAGGLGLNLTSAHCAFILDPWWNPAAEKQAADRLYRMGQKNPVKIYRLIAAHTVEEKMLQLQGMKKDMFDSVIEGATLPRVEIMKQLNSYLVGR